MRPLNFALLVTCLASTTVAATVASPRVSLIHHFDDVQSTGHAGQGQHGLVWGLDGRLYGVSAQVADHAYPVGRWSLALSQEKRQLLAGTSSFYANSGRSIVRSSRGVFYAAAFHQHLCPFDDWSTGQRVIRLGGLYRFSTASSPVMVSLPFLSDGTLDCPQGSLAIDDSDAVYALDSGAGRKRLKEEEAPLAVQAGGLWRLSADEKQFSRVRLFDRDREGDVPVAVIASSDGWLYGLNAEGGPPRLSDGAATQGTIYRVRPDGSGFKVLHGFVGSEQGALSLAAMSSLVDGGDGYLYGSTFASRANQVAIVYRVKKDGSEFRQLHRFNNTANQDGLRAGSSLVLAPDGNIYGTTSGGGQYGNGTVFRIALLGISESSGGFEKVFSFQGAEQGYSPSGLILGLDGRLYGMAEGGEHDEGLIFSIEVEHAKPMLKAFVASSPQVVFGASGDLSTSTLSWNADNAVACEASGDWSGSQPAAGEVEIVPTRAGSNTYSLACRNDTGETVERALAITAIPAVEIRTFSISAATVTLGGSLQVEWAADNAAGCSFSGVPMGSPAPEGVSGNQPTPPLTAVGDYTLTLTCEGEGGDYASASRSVSVRESTYDGSSIQSSTGAFSPLLLVLAGLLAGVRYARNWLLCSRP